MGGNLEFVGAALDSGIMGLLGLSSSRVYDGEKAGEPGITLTAGVSSVLSLTAGLIISTLDIASAVATGGVPVSTLVYVGGAVLGALLRRKTGW